MGPPHWNRKTLNIDWSLQRNVRAGDNPRKVMMFYRKLISEKYTDYSKFFTDGSKGKGRTGYGVFSENMELCGRINDECSVYSAEIMAVCTAIRNIKSKEKTVIFSDSASTLRALETGSSRNPWIQACEYACQGKNISFVWVPGHAGISGNEVADSLANKGRSSDLVYEKLTRHDANKFVEKKTWEAWQDEWSSSNPGTQLNKIKNNVKKWTDRANQYEQRIMTRIRIGHTKLTHSYLLSPYQDAPRCTKCFDILTIEHILLKCHTLKNLRKKYQISGNLKNILKNNSIQEEKIINFVKTLDVAKLL